jgi:Family of unknown function (DUF6115)
MTTSLMELKLLIMAQIGIDLIIVIVFIILLKRLRHLDSGRSFDKPAKAFESLLVDADKMALQFKGQLEEKHRLIQGLNEQLDRRIISLKVLLNRADILLSSPSGGDEESKGGETSHEGQQTEMIKLAKEGHSVEKIAQILSIPKGEVKLVLDLKNKFSRLSKTETLT